jgi:predicted metal-dependent hydrolase
MKSSSVFYPEQQLMRRATGWALRLKVNPTRIVIAPLPKKWGSCSTDGVVTFAEDLATTEAEFQDYVIVHELLHLRYRSHGRTFKAMMTATVPTWRALEGRSRHSTEGLPALSQPQAGEVFR